MVSESLLVLFYLKGLTDAAGKTSLAEALEEVNAEAGGETLNLHLTYSKKLDGVMQQYNNGMLAFCEEEAKTKLVILDRQCLSSYVYQSVFRNNRIKENPEMYSFLQKYAPDTRIVFALPKFDIWKKNFLAMCAERDEMYGADQIDNMVRIYEQYHTIAHGISGNSKDSPWYPDTLLMLQMHNGGVLKHVPNSVVYDYTEYYGLVNTFARKLLAQ